MGWVLDTCRYTLPPVSAAEKEQPSMGAPLPACSVPLLERGDKLHVTCNLWSKGVNDISRNAIIREGASIFASLKAPTI